MFTNKSTSWVYKIGYSYNHLVFGSASNNVRFCHKKIILTVVTIGADFKGGEVTPLFLIGATLGTAMRLLLPLPTASLAGMGFVAVFAGATNTPIACTIMAIELFGIECGLYVAIV